MSTHWPSPVRLRWISASEDRDGHEVAAHVVHVRVAPARRRPGRAGPTLNVSPLHGLHDRSPRLERRVRAARAEAAVRHVDDVGLDLAQVARRRSPMRAITPAAKFSVTTSESATSSRSSSLAALGAQVERDAELLDVVVVEPAAELDAAPVVDERRRAAHDVPRALRHRVLDPDHLRAERREEPRGARAGELAAEVADADVRERTHSAHPHGHRRVAAHGRRVDALEAALVDLPRGVPLQRLVQRDAAFEPRHARRRCRSARRTRTRAAGRCRGGCRSGRGRGSGARRGRPRR